ncbi:hypothetical protein N6C02_003240 [Vibrio fluvialis]|nr:hypothetical protein [Vibrio fluvialis]
MYVTPRVPCRHLYRWFQSLFHDHGQSIEEIADIALKDSELVDDELEKEKSDLILFIRHSLGKASDEDIRHLCPPQAPQKIEYLKIVPEGFLCKAFGTSEEEDFLVLLKLNKNEDLVRNLVLEHNDYLCLLAYKNAHEGYPFGISGIEQVALAGIHSKDLVNIID